MLLCLFNDRRQVSATAIFHDYVEDACVPVYVAVMISNNVIVMEVLQNIPDDRLAAE